MRQKFKVMFAVSILAILMSCQSTQEKKFVYTEPDRPKDWYMSTGASIGTENNYQVIVLSGQNDIFANNLRSVNDFDFSGELRFEKFLGENGWIALQWGVQKKNVTAGQDSGYYLLFDRKSGTCHLFKGPWNSTLKTLFDTKIETISNNRYIKFRIQRTGNKMAIYIDDDKLFEFEDDAYKGGYVGLYSWSEKGITAIYRNIELK